MTIAAIGLTALLAGAAPPAQTARTVRAFVYAELASSQGFVSPAEQGKIDSVNDLQRALIGRKGTLNLVTAAGRDTADVVIQVLGREQAPDDDDKRTVHTKLIVKDYSLAIDGKDDDGSWKDAAKNAAKQILDWINLNYQKLVSG